MIVSQISLLFWNLEVYYCVHKSLLLIPIMSQINYVHILTLHSSRMHFNIILLFMCTSSKWTVAFRIVYEKILAIQYNYSPTDPVVWAATEET
jgi:hypothetical protein